MGRIVPDFIRSLWGPKRAPGAPLPTYRLDDGATRPSPYRLQACQLGIDYVWLEYAMDDSLVTVSRFDRDSVEQSSLGLADADRLRKQLERTGWTQQYRTNHKEGYSYLYGRRKASV